MNTPITIIQMSSALIMILSILLQQRGSGLGATFGGTGNVYRTKRGIEYVLMWVTVVTAILFAFTSLLAVIY
ncbi:MAG: preprotein translocase subunit SecG [Parcubacteria group bacterium]|nr:preprotein translocase subunit SecG [Parcubacteria group bacterium]